MVVCVNPVLNMHKVNSNASTQESYRYVKDLIHSNLSATHSSSVEEVNAHLLFHIHPLHHLVKYTKMS